MTSRLRYRAMSLLLTTSLMTFGHAALAQPHRATIASKGSNRPYVLVLPGILGEQTWDRRIGYGIKQSGLPCDVELYDWTQGPFMMVSNIGGDSREVANLVRCISKFKTTYPDRQLFLIGHSGGCRMVVRVLEALNGQRLIDRAVLLSPGLQSRYDLRRALGGTQHGIVSFHSKLDFPISTPLTFARGITKLRLDASAATFGFEIPETISQRDQISYQQLLVQKEYSPDMLTTGNTGGHFGWTVPRFISAHVVPWLKPQLR